jgi:TolB protein
MGLVGAALVASAVACGATLVAAEDRAEAAFPGNNGKIVFVSDRDGDNDIYTIGSTGDNLKRLTNNSKNDVSPAWSPDGRKIVYSSGLSGTAYSADVFVMNADGSSQTRITDKGSISGTLEGADTNPGFSPDGRKIVFVRADLNNPEGDLYKISADGKNLTRLTRLNFDQPCCPTWSPAGSKIAYSVWDGSDNSIETIKPDGSSQSVFQHGSAPDWSPDGSQVIFSRYGEIYKIDSDGTDEKQLTTSEAYDTAPAFSPDGSKIVFQSARDSNFIYDLYVMDADGTDVRQLTNDPAQEFFTDWRPVH